MSPQSSVRFPFARRLTHLEGPLRHGGLFKQASGKSRAELPEGWPEHHQTCGGVERGSGPNMHHVLDLQ